MSLPTALDNQPWLVGTTETSDQHLRDHFPQLAAILASQYRSVLNISVMILYERQPAAVRADEP